MRINQVLLFIILLTMIASCKNTTNEKNNETFFIRQDSLFVRAYEKRDVNTYQILLKEFLARYHSLPTSAQKQYSGSLTNAYYNFCCTYSLRGDKAMAIN